MPLMSRPVAFGPTWLSRRELGTPNVLGSTNKIVRQLYSEYAPVNLWEDTENISGGIFSLEYSPYGHILVAACEKRSVLLFDPLTLKTVNKIIGAHADCVNCVKFIDNNLFATCSDDNTVALWDARKLSDKLFSFVGHDNWVKSIDYSTSDKLLVTSGFDGNIFTWDINNFNDPFRTRQHAFSMNGLMRTRLTPEGDKCIVSTTAGYILVVHNLELSTLYLDLLQFKPNLYRLMQLSQTLLPNASEFKHLFNGFGKRNRVEFICDFPEGDDAEVLSSLQPHPHGHSIVSRNISNDDSSEWTCVHNIEEFSDSEDSEDDSESISCPVKNSRSSTRPTRIFRISNDDRRNSNALNADLLMSPTDIWEAVVAIHDARSDTTNEPSNTTQRAPLSEPSNRMGITEDFAGRTRFFLPAEAVRGRRRPRVDPSVVLGDVTFQDFSSDEDDSTDEDDPGEGTSAGPCRRAAVYAPAQRWRRRRIQRPARRRVPRRLQTRYEVNETTRLSRCRPARKIEEFSPPERVILMGVYRTRGQDGQRGTSMQRHNIGTLTVTPGKDDDEFPVMPKYTSSEQEVKINKDIHQNTARLTHFIEEPNVGRGFIKELCFSPDGRVLCSPFGNGVRLLSFSPDVEDLEYCYPKRPPKPLHELSLIISHKDIVVSTKFSPAHSLLASGSLFGRICVHQPFRQ